MLMPSLFNDSFDVFDRLYQDPWWDFDDRQIRNAEKKLYGRHGKNIMSTDIKESESGYEMEVDLPGFQKDEISAELKDGYLTISATKGLDQNTAENEEQAKDGKYIRRERYCGSCQRSFYVGEALRQEDIKASFKDGILKLCIPKKEVQQIPQNRYIAIEG